MIFCMYVEVENLEAWNAFVEWLANNSNKHFIAQQPISATLDEVETMLPEYELPLPSIRK